MKETKLKRKNNTQKGITLIALIITIIVLLILAIVAIRAVTGNGILDYAKKAKEEYGLEQLKENVNLVLSGRKITKETGGNLNDLKEDLETIQGATVEKAGNGVYYVTKDGYTLTVYEDENDIENGKISVWNGTDEEVPEIKEFNWYIYNGGQLKFLADFVNNGNTLTDDQRIKVVEKGYNESDIIMNENIIVYLMEDIDLGKKDWTPIGTSKELKLQGTFEGNNHFIKGANVNVEGNFAGIFGNSNTIHNLTVKNSYIKATGNCAGGIVGALRTGEIMNCHNINTQVEADGSDVGGIVGQHTGTLTTDCTNSGKISGKSFMIGGIIGAGSSTNARIQNCKNTGIVLGEIGELANENDDYGIGGIVGAQNSDSILINNVNYGSITGLWFVGGISGADYSGVKTDKCANYGDITARGYVGGIIGACNGTANKCYNIGKVTQLYTLNDSYAAGGIVGNLYQSGAIIDCGNKGKIEIPTGGGGIAGRLSR